MKKMILITCLFLVANLGYAQTSDTIPLFLTKKQMYADFDQLVKIVKMFNAQQYVRKQLTGYDMVARIQEQRKTIDTIDNYWTFIELMEKCVYLTLDVHALMLPSYSSKYKRLEYPLIDSQYVEDLYQKYNDYCFQKFLNRPYTLSLTQNIYHQGEYYALGEYKLFSNKSSDTITLTNFKILNFHNRPIDSFVNDAFGSTEGVYWRWDFERKKYFTNPSLSYHSIIVEDMTTKQQYRMKLDTISASIKGTNLEINIYQKCYQIPKIQKKVSWYPQHQLLYIYVNKMDDTDTSLIDSIKTIGKGKDIRKIILDVRDNGGGSDLAWRNMLSAIIKDTIRYESKVGINPYSKVKKCFKKIYPDFEKWTKKERIDFISREKMIVWNSNESIIPDSNSLQYDKTIYVLQNQKTYSAAHSLTSLCRQVPQLVSVGEPTGHIAGFGINPAIFQLKNSKFTFQFEAVLDISNAKSLEETFQDIPEIEIYPTLKEAFIRKDFPRNYLRTDDFLFNYDYLFKKVLEM